MLLGRMLMTISVMMIEDVNSNNKSCNNNDNDDGDNGDSYNIDND